MFPLCIFSLKIYNFKYVYYTKIANEDASQKGQNVLFFHNDF